MARSGENLGTLIAGLIMLVAVAGWIADFAQINILWSLAIIVGVAIGGSFLAWATASISKWLKSRKRCEHGIRAGSQGGCRTCQAEAEQTRNQWELETARRNQLQGFKDGARQLREQEIERLSKAWLSRTDAYLGMTPQQFENAIAELFRALGYRVEQTPYSNDGGKDAIAYKDGKKHLIECKRYAPNRSIGRRDLQIL